MTAITILIFAFAHAQAEKPAEYGIMSGSSFPGLDKQISLDIRAMDIVHFLKFLAVQNWDAAHSLLLGVG